MQRWLLLILAFVFAVPAVQAQENPPGLITNNSHVVPCSRYHSGHMIYSAEPYFGIKVIRRGKKNIEINPQTGVKTIFKIKWESDCKYNLYFKKANGPTRYRKGWMQEVEITQAYDEYYDFKADLHGIVSYGTVKKDLSPREIKAKRRMEEDSLKQAKKDSIRIARGDTIPTRRDSVLAAKQAHKDSIAKAQGKQEGDPEGEQNQKAGKKKKGKEENADDPANAKSEEKPEKAPKEKKSKEKKEKAVKEKKEKAPKEKKEKPPKEKKEKPAKDEQEDE